MQFQNGIATFGFLCTYAGNAFVNNTLVVWVTKRKYERGSLFFLSLSPMNTYNSQLGF